MGMNFKFILHQKATFNLIKYFMFSFCWNSFQSWMVGGEVHRGSLRTERHSLMFPLFHVFLILDEFPRSRLLFEMWHLQYRLVLCEYWQYGWHLENQILWVLCNLLLWINRARSKGKQLKACKCENFVQKQHKIFLLADRSTCPQSPKLG